MNIFLTAFISGAAFLLGFLLFLNPAQQNIKANKWLGFFMLTIGCAFISSYMVLNSLYESNIHLFRFLICTQFLAGASLFISTLYFVSPVKSFSYSDALHFLPFIVYATAEVVFGTDKASISSYTLFAINSNVSFLVRDLLPFLNLFYIIKSYMTLKKHRQNIQLISSSIGRISLNWLRWVLLTLFFIIVISMNDALFELPILTPLTNIAYSISIFFLAYFSIRQKNIFDYKETEAKEIAVLLSGNSNSTNTKPVSDQTPPNTSTIIEGNTPVTMPVEKASKKAKTKRISNEQMSILGKQLVSLMENEKLYLENDLGLPEVANRLGISIHEASFLVNEVTGLNFYNFINRYRVEEAKKLLASARASELNILGIAFASGFNSKTTFNTAFRKWAGISPSGFMKNLREKREI
ncbi:MAG: AraC family transcriptional regulator [Bacteroidetes bacterium]|nr:AraC family transcriptional regulator [Bacteroidota bacterium]